MLKKSKTLLMVAFLAAAGALVGGCEGKLSMALGLAEGAAGALSKVALDQVTDPQLDKIEEISGEGAEVAGKIEGILTTVHEAAVDEQTDRLEREQDD